MKKQWLLIIFILFLIAILYPHNDFTSHKVIKVIDGDTLYIDFNDNYTPEKEEKVRLNGIDAFETKYSELLKYQMEYYGFDIHEVLGLGYLGKEFAKIELLNKEVIAIYSANKKLCSKGRKLMSVYYDCKTPPKIQLKIKNLFYTSHLRKYCKCYEEEVLKYGFATVFRKSNLATKLKQYENFQKIKANKDKANKLNLVLLNNKNGKYHKPTCKYALNATDVELIQKPSSKYIGAGCCYPKN